MSDCIKHCGENKAEEGIDCDGGFVCGVLGLLI